MIEVVCATRHTEGDFWSQSAIGQSLKRMACDTRIAACPAFANERGLPDVYNERIVADSDAEILLFAHDDVWLDDCFLADRILDGLRCFDVLGVAGNRRRLPRQPAWAFVDLDFNWDDKSSLSGRVGHGPDACGEILHFGDVPAECELLDGVLLAVRRSTLRMSGVRFDPRFKFHFYDLDFCRSARQCGLRLGTWPMAITHQSYGGFRTPQWEDGFRRYLDKWNE